MGDEGSQQQLAMRFRLLAESSQHFASIRGVADLLAAVARRLGEAVGDGCGVWLVAHEGAVVEIALAGSFHPDPELMVAMRLFGESQPLRVGEGITGQVVLTGHAALLPVIDPQALVELAPLPFRAIAARLAICSVLSVPLRSGERVLGAITLMRSSPERPYTTADQELAQDLADRAALAVENALLVAELERANAALRRSDSRHRRLAESGVIGIVVSNMSGRILEVNDAFLQMTGYTREDLDAGRLTSAVFVRPDERAATAEARARIRVGAVAVPNERELLRKDGSRFPALIGGARLEESDGEIVAFVLDLSERKSAELRARSLAAQAATAEILRREKDAIEAANKELEAFSYSVAHDLRAPLRAINGFTTAVLEDQGHVLDENAKGLLHRVTASTRRMADLIDALLALASLSRVEIDRQAVDLAAIARSVVEQLVTGDPGRRVELVAPPQLEVSGDPDLLRALLENVIGNAWKFTRDSADARIEIFATDLDGVPHVHVRDNGVGFDMAYADKLFAPFQRLHPRADFDGSGVGLATVERIVRRHGGEVTAVGTVDGGATVSFTLALAPARNTS